MSVNITVTVQSSWLSRDMFGSSVLMPDATRSIEVNRSPLSRAFTRPSGDSVGGPMTVPRDPPGSDPTTGGATTTVIMVSPTSIRSSGATGVGPTTRVAVQERPVGTAQVKDCEAARIRHEGGVPSRGARIAEEQAVAVAPDLEVAAHDDPDRLASRLTDFHDHLGHGPAFHAEAAKTAPCRDGYSG